MSPPPLVTVVVPTYNGAEYLDALLAAVARQVVDGEIEVIVVDSGSTDATMSIVARYPDSIVIEIPNSEFGHGRTRDMAARRARGTFVAYLSQDAVPVGDYWLAELLHPFSLDARVALVTGRQKPRARAFPLQKYEIVGAFRAQGPDAAVTLHGATARPLTGPEAAEAAFHSDVNAAVRRELVIGDLPFRDVSYAEDQQLARDALDAGWLRAYAGRAVVEHSNDLTLREFGPRIFDETVGLRRIGTPIPPMSRRAQFSRALRGTLADTLRILRDRDFGFGTRLRWCFVNPAYHVAKWSAYRRASRADLSDPALASRSLEAARRSGAS